MRPELLESAEFINRKSKRKSIIAPFHALAVANMNLHKSLIAEHSPAKRQGNARELLDSIRAKHG
ncbi:Hypothetical protein P9303_05871 [Prochlorococcus marinus str. MIT 9303]|uniref:Uncharacterized protein n=1 Tax=Prochlorococcus marinus (strain MIT 9303) TaxID=59922 RepID=A2C779_PROM3|nr:Hypothetical protein P9303_05871 [Prochlorococcus marinus str. MIT 9303]